MSDPLGFDTDGKFVERWINGMAPLQALSAFEIALARSLILQASGGGWLDRDAEDYGEHWASMGAWSTYQSLAEDLWAALKQAWPLLAADRFEAAWSAAGLDRMQADVRRSGAALDGVHVAYVAWWPVFWASLVSSARARGAGPGTR